MKREDKVSGPVRWHGNGLPCESSEHKSETIKHASLPAVSNLIEVTPQTPEALTLVKNVPRVVMMCLHCWRWDKFAIRGSVYSSRYLLLLWQGSSRLIDLRPLSNTTLDLLRWRQRAVQVFLINYYYHLNHWIFWLLLFLKLSILVFDGTLSLAMAERGFLKLEKASWVLSPLIRRAFPPLLPCLPPIVGGLQRWYDHNPPYCIYECMHQGIQAAVGRERVTYSMDLM